MLLTTFPRICRAAACAALLAGALGPQLAQAQTPADFMYHGPRYPGGPDSLRATIGRMLRTANPAWAAPVVVRLQCDANGAVQKIQSCSLHRVRPLPSWLAMPKCETL